MKCFRRMFAFFSVFVLVAATFSLCLSSFCDINTPVKSSITLLDAHHSSSRAKMTYRTPIANTTLNYTALPEKEWTIIVYQDGDNNLEGAAVEDLEEMETVGSTEQVNIVVLLDRATPEAAGADSDDTSHEDWTTTRLYYVTKDSNPDAFGSELLVDYGELDMGDPQTLVDFVLLVFELWPAKHYFLDLWNHGGAFWGVCWDDTNNGSSINMPELSWALNIITGKLGRKIDLLAFDACLMSQDAIYYEVSEYVGVMAASSTTEPGDGWPYELLLPAVVNNPNITAQDFAAHLVDVYVESYTDFASDPQDSPRATMAAFDMEKMKAVFFEMNNFAKVLSRNAGDRLFNAYIKNIKINGGPVFSRPWGVTSYDTGSAWSFDWTGYPLYDVVDFIQTISNSVPGSAITPSEVKAAGKRVIDAISAARINEKHGPGYDDAYGLTFYFPDLANAVVKDATFDNRYLNTKWAQQTFWDEFLVNYFGNITSASNTPPTLMITSPSTFQILNSSQTSIEFSGVAVDDGKVSSVLWRIVNDSGFATNWIPAYGTDNWNFTVNLTGLEGEYAVEVKATDGNMESAPVSRNITVEKVELPEEVHKEGLSPIWIILVIVVFAAGVAGFIYFRKKKGMEKGK